MGNWGYFTPISGDISPYLYLFFQTHFLAHDFPGQSVGSTCHATGLWWAARDTRGRGFHGRPSLKLRVYILKFDVGMFFLLEMPIFQGHPY